MICALEAVRELKRERDRYRRALEKAATKGGYPAACDRTTKPNPRCHCYLCIVRVALLPRPTKGA